MNRTTARLLLTVAGASALTGPAAGAAHADTPADRPDAAPAAGPDAAPGPGTDGATATYLLHGIPAAPIEDPTFGVFDVAAPAYGVLGSLG